MMDRNRATPTSPSMVMPLALALLLHLVALAVASQVVTPFGGRQSTTTTSIRLALQPTREEKPAKAEPPSQEKQPDQARELEFKPGIADGSPDSDVWLGFDEYKEQIAPHASVDQAAFTMSKARGAPNGTATDAHDRALPKEVDAPGSPIVGAESHAVASITKPDESKPASETENDPSLSNVTDQSSSVQVAAPLPSSSSPAALAGMSLSLLPPSPRLEATPAPIQDSGHDDTLAGRDAAILRHLSTGTDWLARSVSPDFEKPSSPATINNAAKQMNPTPPMTAPADETSQGASQAPTPGAAPVRGMPLPKGDSPSSDPNAHMSDKESAATSTQTLPATVLNWKDGQPLAAKGMEILPYPLYRHIAWDSGDTLFNGDFEHLMQHNPVVGIRFNREGRVGAIRVLRDSGYTEFDTRYLKSWMARWTARDAKLAQMKPGELTAELVIRLEFIDDEGGG